MIVLLLVGSQIKGGLHARVWPGRLEKCGLVALIALLFGDMSVDEVDATNIFLFTWALLYLKLRQIIVQVSFEQFVA